jgi:integrase
LSIIPASDRSDAVAALKERLRDVRELVEEKAQTAPIQGNRVLERISALFTFAVDQDWIEANPAWRIKKPGQERTRDRVLTRDELRELWPALHDIDAFLVMLLTAQRCGEVCQIRTALAKSD